MNHCASCGYELPPGTPICPHHLGAEPGWAQGNRLMCDLLHRGIVPRRLPPRDRDDELIRDGEAVAA